MDRDGKLVVAELKRNRADENTDLQAIKYASFCATLTSEEIQKDYREFWNKRNGGELQPEDVGNQFADFLSQDSEEDITQLDAGWAEFDLDDKPRILLAAGSFGTEVTAPVMWLIEEYGMDITCTRVQAYEHEKRILLNSQQVIPIQEAEEYMTKRREKQEKQESTEKRPRAITVLIERGILQKDDRVGPNPELLPHEEEWEWEPDDDDFWVAEITGDIGRSDNVCWLYDGQTYSFTGLTKELIESLTGSRPSSLNGYKYWCHPAFENRTLSDLRNSKVTAPERQS